ncbi:MAG: hypothetical protein J6W61_03230 [Bacteroidales bacterium]|nr:hypothetical protein [Bacteroidales bacterium]
MKRPLGLIPGLIILVIFVIACFNYTKKTRQYYEKTAEIKKEDSINLEVIKTWEAHGYLTFNDSLTIVSHMIEQPNLQLMFVYEIGLPFFLIKEANNDTIWLMNSDNTYFFVFKKGKENNEHQTDPQEFRRLFKALFHIN